MLYDDADKTTAHRVAYHLLNNKNVVWQKSVTNSPKAKCSCLAFTKLPVLKCNTDIILFFSLYIVLFFFTDALFLQNYKSRSTCSCSIACLRYCTFTLTCM